MYEEASLPIEAILQRYSPVMCRELNGKSAYIEKKCDSFANSAEVFFCFKCDAFSKIHHCKGFFVYFCSCIFTVLQIFLKYKYIFCAKCEHSSRNGKLASRCFFIIFQPFFGSLCHLYLYFFRIK